MTETPPAPGSARQTFLVGETLYLRGLEPNDAKRATAWRASPFPISTARAEELLKKEIPAAAERGKSTLLACRRADDEPVGAVRIEIEGWRVATVRPHADLTAGVPAEVTKAEILRLVVPWLSAERQMMVVWTELDADEGETVAAAEALAMRPAFRLREALQRGGRRHDMIGYELLHPTWIERLGDPGPGIARAVPPGVVPTAPARRHSEATDEPAPPPKVVMLGERVILRASEVGDAEAIARWSREETETTFSNGRGVRSQAVLAHVLGDAGEHEPPETIEFAIALRDGGELIGDNGLYGIDWVHRTAETGTMIYRKEHRNGGLGTEAKHLLLEYAFERLGLHMVRSLVWSFNLRSAAALRKQGYRDAGHMHWVGVGGGAGEFAGDSVFDLLAEEWRAHRKGAG